MDMSAQYSLKSAIFYARPRSTSDVLPVVYGDMTIGGSGGQWVIPCIDTDNRIYAVSGQPILSVADGNSITIYNQNGEVLGGYVFDESNSVESNGNIAIITFPTKTASTISFDATDNSINDSSAGLAVATNCYVVVTGATNSENNSTFKIIRATASKWVLDGERSVTTESAGASIILNLDQSSNEPLSARGKGRAIGAALIVNPITQIEDFIVNLVPDGAQEDFDSTCLERARNICSELGYESAGAIDSNQSIGTIVSEIISCFLGSWYIGPSGKIILSIDQGASILNESMLCASFAASATEDANIEANVNNLCNQVRAHYAYNYATQEYNSTDEGTLTANGFVRSLYGDQTRDFYWKWVRSPVVVAALQSLIVSMYATPVRIYTVYQGSFENIPLVRGDFVLMSCRWILNESGGQLINQIARIIGIQQDFNSHRIEFRLMDMKVFKTVAYLADGAISAGGVVMAGGERDLTEY